MVDINELLGRLRSVHQNRNGWSACCPAHDDKSPSLSIKQDNGRILVHCHAGCSFSDVWSALGMGAADSRPPSPAAPAPRPSRSKTTFGRPEEAIEAAIRSLSRKQGETWHLAKSYSYRDADRHERFQVLRLESKKDKTFRPIHSVEGGWAFGLPEGLRPLYRLLELPAEAPVYVCEGEKAVEAAIALGLPAVTSASGAKSANKTDWSPLAGRQVTILPDNDEAGTAYAREVAALVRLVDPTSKPRILALPGLGQGEDIVEFIALRRKAGKDDAAIRAEIESLAKEVEVKPALRPPIIVEGGDLPQVVGQAEAALINAKEEIFQQNHRLVRVVRHAQPPKEGSITRAAGAVITREVEPAFLVDRMTATADFQRYDARSKSYRSIDCPERLAKTYLAREGSWKVPVLSGVIEAPTLLHDGSILERPGYDPRSGIYLALTTALPPVPRQPTLDDARAALAKFKDLLRTFPFVTSADLAVMLAALLTILIRKSLRTAPMFAFTAPTMASGKTLLASLCGIVGTGRSPSMMAQGKDEEESKKRYLSVLLEGDPVSCIDNVDRPFGGPTICSILTESFYKDRILGKSENAAVGTQTTWLVTGNNLVFEGDIATRVVISMIDPQVERPEERTFEGDLRERFLERRHELVVAGLTVLRAFHVAGRPSQGLAPFGRFEDWSDWIRPALVWCGEADPCETRSRLQQTDPASALLAQVLLAWFEQFQSCAITTAELIQGADHLGGDAPLRQAIFDVAGGRDGKINHKRLGNWIAGHVGRIQQGLRLVRFGDRKGSALWKVERVAQTTEGSAGSESSPHYPVGNCQCDTSYISKETNPQNKPNPPFDNQGDEEVGTCRL